MKDDGSLKLEWDAHLLRQKTRESCRDIATAGSSNKAGDDDDDDDDGNKDSTDGINRRHLSKSSTSSETEKEVRDYVDRLTLRQMVCTTLIKVHTPPRCI
jgi:hypothetical protein